MFFLPYERLDAGGPVPSNPGEGSSTGPMPEAVRLYFDATCGPCTLFAGASLALGRGRIRLRPLTSAECEPRLARMDPEARYGAFHLVGSWSVSSGEAAVVPLVGLTLGRSAERIARGAPPLRLSLEWIYRWFWTYRRTRGCAAPLA
jgi:hypothetical protein